MSLKFYLLLSWTQACVSTAPLSSLVCLLVSRMYHAEKLPKTNLVFIIADAKLTCLSCDNRPLIQDEQQCILLPSSGNRRRAFDSLNRCFKLACFWQDNGGWALITTRSRKQIFPPLAPERELAMNNRIFFLQAYVKGCFLLSVILTVHYFPHLHLLNPPALIMSEHFRRKWHSEFRCVLHWVSVWVCDADGSAE